MPLASAPVFVYTDTHTHTHKSNKFLKLPSLINMSSILGPHTVKTGFCELSSVLHTYIGAHGDTKNKVKKREKNVIGES